ncbi:MAG: HAMP domain-containing sensor histidine kinase [Leptolyngbyaceae cyanobacterium bins.302]|nr:HAMP domain-containing sensor histidine kinase [Leptolyngbyaceae cyanobacterium bins.302]
MLPFQRLIRSKDWHLNIFWLVVALFIILLVLEYTTPAEYVFGYLYIGPILLASTHLNRRTTFTLTIVACIMTMLNACLPGIHYPDAPTIASRAIATIALIVTGVLSDRNQLFQKTVLQQQATIQAQEKLANVREDFASTLTHDLKTPLLGAIETLKAFQQGSFGQVQPTQQAVLATMIRSHSNTLQIVETLLDVYRNDNEGLPLHQVPVDLVKLAEDVTATLIDLAASRRVHISLNYGESDFRKFLWVRGDAFQLQRVIANLLTNAINHSPRGEKVEVIFETNSSYQTVKVVDHGAGVRSEELLHLFERFYQGQSDRHAKGSGLGLYLSRQIVEAHGGTIWTEARRPTGAIFAFRLPAFPHHLPASP